MGEKTPRYLRVDADEKHERLCHGVDLKWVYIFISFFGIAMTVAVLFNSHGTLFNKIFFGDSLDTGMDFFHSIEYTKGRVPYEQFGTLYPPLANLFFYCLFRFVPEWQYKNWAPTFSEGIKARGTNVDLRVYQPTMLIFMIYLMVSAVLVTYMIQAYFRKTDRAQVKLLGICVLLSQSMLYAYERGNIIVLAWLTALFFIHYRNSENPVLREMALIALAISAGLKIYPALLGMLLLYDKQYVRAGRTVLYGIALFTLPCLVFKEGFSGLTIFFQKLLKHSDRGTLNLGGYDFAGIGNSINYLMNQSAEAEAEEIAAVFGKIHNVIATSAALLLGFFMKKRWQQILLCSMAILLFQSQGNYGMTFMLLPLLAMLKEENSLNWRNAVPFVAMMGCTVMFPLLDSETFPYSLRSFRLQLCMIILMGYFLVETGILLYRAGKGFIKRG